MIGQLRKTFASSCCFPTAAVRRRRHHRRSLSCGSLECSERLEKRLLLSAVTPLDLQPIRIAESMIDDAGTVNTIDRTPTVEWNESDPTVTYDIWGTQVGVKARKFFAAELTEPQFIPQSPLADGQYRIFVRAEFADGSVSHWSSPFDMVVLSSPLPQPVDPFTQSLTWIPRPEVEPWSIIESQPVVPIVLPDVSAQPVGFLPTPGDTEWLTTSSALDLNALARPNDVTTPDKPKLDVAEADRNVVESPESVEPGDQPDESDTKRNDSKRAAEDQPAEPDTPNADRPPIKRIAEEPKRNGMAHVEQSPRPWATEPTRGLNAESADIDRAFAELAISGLLAAI